MKPLSLLLRLGLGALFVVAGVRKLTDPVQFAIEITNYRLLPQLAPYLAVLLPAVEIAAGAGVVLLPRAWRQASALVLSALLLAFTVAIALALSRGINIDCGCFGGNTGPISGFTVARDLALLAAAAFVLWTERPLPRLT